ncbi:MFS monosaccharide transporter [Seiridium cupressi]
MTGGVVIKGTTDVGRGEAPVTIKAYLICAFAAFDGILFGYNIGLVIGIAILVLIIGIHLVVCLLDKLRPQYDRSFAAHAAAYQQAADETRGDFDPYMNNNNYEIPPPQQPTISVQSPSESHPPPEVHPALRNTQPQEPHPPDIPQKSTMQHVQTSPPVPQSLMLGKWNYPPLVPPRIR